MRHGVALFGSPPREPWGRLVQIIPSGGHRDVRHLAVLLAAANEHKVRLTAKLVALVAQRPLLPLEAELLQVAEQVNLFDRRRAAVGGFEGGSEPRMEIRGEPGGLDPSPRLVS